MTVVLIDMETTRAIMLEGRRKLVLTPNGRSGIANKAYIWSTVTSCCCKTCGYNVTHGSGGHNKWQTNPNQKDKGLEKEQALLAQTGPEVVHPPLAAPACSSVSEPSTLTSGGDTLAFSRASLQQRSASFEQNSTDPNAANIAAAMRTMFLN